MGDDDDGDDGGDFFGGLAATTLLRLFSSLQHYQVGFDDDDSAPSAGRGCSTRSGRGLAVLAGKADRACTVSLPGGDLQIEWREADNRIFMTGPAEPTFRGEYALK